MRVIAKNNVLPQTAGQSENAPLLAPLSRYWNGVAGAVTLPSSLRDRRVQALGSHIADRSLLRIVCSAGGVGCVGEIVCEDGGA